MLLGRLPPTSKFACQPLAAPLFLRTYAPYPPSTSSAVSGPCARFSFGDIFTVLYPALYLRHHLIINHPDTISIHFHPHPSI
ncbi:hypothetical protein BDN71DRAFT_852833 [Pleurotus eryngii]|uniref:Uncharacterized protein n=1 Tax=Pleurotus eryngii TaxID=5323 RepID=A0A9P6A7Z5_PLEER|nr:hypothetical protein BDN71DRAFT_852833 [Pleurotus eryngii]